MKACSRLIDSLGFWWLTKADEFSHPFNDLR